MSKLQCMHGKCKNVILMDNYCSRHLKQKCAVCFEEVPSTNSAKHKRLHCGHAFHINCILGWFVESEDCPICRKPHHDELIKFKDKIENNMRKKYMDAIRSLELENKNLRKMLN